MDEKRMGEVALALLRYKATREDIRITPNINRELGNVAKETGVPLAELKEFARVIFSEVIAKHFGN
jgi:propanediol dehydratase small subunit